MDLTKELKSKIEVMTYHELLLHWRFARAGHLWFQGESGEYWKNRMQELLDSGADHTAVSKAIGWK